MMLRSATDGGRIPGSGRAPCAATATATALWRQHLVSLSEARGRARRRFVAAALFAATLLAAYAEARAVEQVPSDPARGAPMRAPPAPDGTPYRTH